MFLQKSNVQPQPTLVFETKIPLLFSFYSDGAFEKKWKQWKPVHFELREDASMIYMKSKDAPNFNHILDLSSTYLQRIPIGNDSDALVGVVTDIGVRIKCRKDGFDTEFRCVFPEGELMHFLDAIDIVSQSHNLKDFKADMKWDTAPDWIPVSSARMNSLRLEPHIFDEREPGQCIIAQSVMRRAIVKEMDQFDKTERKRLTVARRGAFKWLPVFFSNDLVHGSWWFVLGSIYTTCVSVLVLLNNYYPTILGDDDSILPEFEYRASWIMMTISGVFYTIGSLAFVRAVNEPPLKPLFPSLIHFQTDELLGSWMFFIATLPAVPYSLVYLSVTHDYAYVVLCGLSILCLVGTYFFVLSCYPSDTGRRSTLLNCLLCCCGRQRFIMKHFANDWLVGTWIIFWGTFLFTVFCFAILVSELSQQHHGEGRTDAEEQGGGSNPVAMFVYATTFTDCIGFLIGAMYFVAGSYPVDEVSSPESVLILNEGGSHSAKDGLVPGVNSSLRNTNKQFLSISQDEV